MGMASTRKIYIREGLSPFANVFSWIRKSCQFANISFADYSHYIVLHEQCFLELSWNLSALMHYDGSLIFCILPKSYRQRKVSLKKSHARIANFSKLVKYAFSKSSGNILLRLNIQVRSSVSLAGLFLPPLSCFIICSIYRLRCIKFLQPLCRLCTYASINSITTK